jgi:uncharacterized protein
MTKEAFISSLVSLFPLPQYVVVLEDKSKTHLIPIWIGVNEGNAIALEMNGEKFPRPLTHDLIVNILTEVGAKIERIEISDIKDSSYFAKIYIRLAAKVYEIDARPSDSLAVAVRVKCPIFVNEKVLERCPVVERPITQGEVERFKTELKKMTPEEFFRKLESTPGKKKDIENLLGPGSVEEGGSEEEEPEDEDDEDTEEKT